jgi:hypothetical protein
MDHLRHAANDVHHFSSELRGAHFALAAADHRDLLSLAKRSCNLSCNLRATIKKLDEALYNTK